ncbi:pyridoxamine 5'-phosphate oxidase family protein [Belnapia sp. T6]|uniref:Pyridoxamine 5'-phosphate oxidase family protein n=1 Tax=Belnapia mucosa TaxID=2804532 RepID=A0ABS1V8Q6_9PROT|nr:MSMEG_1061 family FMN-dependent PPOX-type flavoprotein [Belnapia mucosa]MBL6457732.1 pyridoxamine 5'-phosphate oxidase family protein [Belnapia mucosa]
MSGDPHAIETPEQLAAHYAAPHPRFLAKVTDRLEATSLAFIAASPWCVLATCGRRGAHATPRGDAPGFVQAIDERTLALPDRRGNNRLDAFHDILENPEVALLFVVPGAGETLRVNGRARLTADPALRARFAVEGKEPATVLLVTVREIYAHCAKSVMRSRLWGEQPRPAGLPTNGQLIAAHTAGGRIDAAEYEAAYQARIRAEMY